MATTPPEPADIAPRDYFATRAPTPPTAFFDTEEQPEFPVQDPAEPYDPTIPRRKSKIMAKWIAQMTAKWAYLYADAMMAERKK